MEELSSTADGDVFKMPILPAMPPPSKQVAKVKEKIEPLVALSVAEEDGKENNQCSKEVEIGDVADIQEDSEKAVAQPVTARLKASPAELVKANQIPLPYQEPSWGGIPDQLYSLEVIKNGSQVATIPLKDKSFFVVGRLANCDIILEHPSLSR